MRLIALMLSLIFVCAGCAQAKNTPHYDKNPKKHALLVMDADSGKVLYHEKGYSKRYPASLTKMMTLYMTFDAMRKGRINKSTKMVVSKRAAKQPQTNIGLRKGNRITVDQVIRSLVVRSANDSSVVIAEKLGGSVERFAMMMTQKSRTLGMKRTNFKNANGLPNSGQYTSAYDMAVLGAALRRDFPQYYNYFKIQEFSYKGRKYKGHNRVLGMYGGVDGIKTGYIRASGFNLVTSVKKDGFNIISVVLGSKSSRARDAFMVSVLDRTFTGLARIKDRPRAFASAPYPESNPLRTRRAVARAEALKAKEPVFSSGEPAKSIGGPADDNIKINDKISSKKVAPKAKAEKAVKVASVAAAPKAKLSFNLTPQAKKAPAAKVQVSNVVKVKSASPSLSVALKPSPVKAKKGTLDYQMAKLNQSQSKTAANRVEPSFLAGRKSKAKSKGWGIQVGAFQNKRMARTVVAEAFRLVESDINDEAYITIASYNAGAGEIHKAMLANMSKTQANNACHKLEASGQNCFALPVN